MAGWPTALDVEVRSGRTFTMSETDQVSAALTDTIAAVRAYTGQQVYPSAATTARLKVKDGKVRLPQRPVTAVASVVNVTNTPSAALTFSWKGGELVEPLWLPAANGPDNYSWSHVHWVDVTYTHGYADVPGDLFALVCQVAGRAYGAPAAQSGVQSENIGSYGYTLGAAAAQGAVGFLAGERSILDRYRRPASAIVTG